MFHIVFTMSLCFTVALAPLSRPTVQNSPRLRLLRMRELQLRRRRSLRNSSQRMVLAEISCHLMSSDGRVAPAACRGGMCDIF